MGRNGAGKSTLLRTAAGLVDPVRGRVETPSGMALLTQNPSDYLVRERVGDELPGRGGRGGAADRRPRARGRRRSARPLRRRAPAAGAGDRPGRPHGGRGAARAGRPRRADPRDGPRPQGRPRRADRGPRRRAAPRSLVATHDVEFAAAFAERVVLLGDGVVIADGPAEEVLSGGWYFATEVARVLDLPGVITPEQGGAALAAARAVDELAAGQLPRSSAPSCSAASPGTSARARRRRWSPWSPPWPRWRSPGGSPSPPSPTSSRPPTSSSSPATRSARRRASRSARSPPWSPTSGSGRGRGRRGRWRPGGCAGSSARRWRSAPATSAASRSPRSAASPASPTARCSTSR